LAVIDALLDGNIKDPFLFQKIEHADMPTFSRPEDEQPDVPVQWQRRLSFPSDAISSMPISGRTLDASTLAD